MRFVNHIIPGILGGLLLPAAFIWVYLHHFYASDILFADALGMLWGSALFGKLLLLSITPDLVLMFVFYKLDFFRAGAGAMLGMVPYLITSILMSG